MSRTAAGRIGYGMGYAPPPPIIKATSTPNGGWTEVPWPKAVHYNGKTYLNWVDSTNGSVKVAAYDHAARTLSTPVTVGSGLPDDGATDVHNSGSILIRDSDKRIIVGYCGHEDTKPRFRISTNPEDASAFGSEIAPNVGSNLAVTYVSLVQLLGEANDPIYAFFRWEPGGGTNTAKLVYSKSTDGGATWSTLTELVTGAANKVPYWRIISNDFDRVDIFITTGSPNDAATSLHHLYMTGGLIYASDGTQLTGTLPILVSDATEVLPNTEGPSMAWGAAYSGGGTPAAVVMHATSDTDNAIKVARWTGTAWQVDTVVSSVGGHLGINKYASGCAIDPADPDTVYIAKKIGAKFEMFRYTSADSGSTWTATQLTGGSSADNVWVDVPKGAASGLRALWLYGIYTNDTSYSFGISAAP